MYKQIKINKSEVRQIRDKFEKYRLLLEEEKRKVENLPFYDGNEHLSSGKCAEQMVNITLSMEEVIVSLDGLIGKVDLFLNEALKEFSEKDEVLAQNYKK